MGRFLGGTQAHKNNNRHSRARDILSQHRGGIIMIAMIVIMLLAHIYL